VVDYPFNKDSVEVPAPVQPDFSFVRSVRALVHQLLEQEAGNTLGELLVLVNYGICVLLGLQVSIEVDRTGIRLDACGMKVDNSQAVPSAAPANIHIELMRAHVFCAMYNHLL